MLARKTAKRPKKLRCRPGYKQRGSACQKITNKSRVQAGSTLGKIGAAIKDYVAARVAPHAAWSANSEERERNLQIKGYNEINGEKAHPNLVKNLRKAENAIKDNNFESLAMLDSKGNTLLSKPGGKYDVQITSSEVAKIMKASRAGKGVVVTHNHPKMYGDYAPSLSVQDIKCAGALGAKQIRAVSGDEIFIMNPPKGKIFSPELSKRMEESYNKRLPQVSSKYTMKAIAGMSVSEANMRASHELWEEVMKDIPEINYQKLSRGNARYVKGYSK